MRVKCGIVLSLTVAVYLAIRLAPIIAFGYLGTDSWPMLYNVRALVRHTPVPIDSEVFDGYNNLWPATILLSSVYVVVTGVDLVSLELVMPFVSCVAVLFLYIVYRRFGSGAVALFVALNALHIYVAGTVTKEALAIVYMAELIYLVAVRMLYVPYALSLVSLAMSHHFTSFIYVTFSVVNAALNPGRRSLCNAAASVAVVSVYNRFYGLSRMGGVAVARAATVQSSVLVHAAFVSLASMVAFCVRRGGHVSIALSAALATFLYVLYTLGVMNPVYVPYAVLVLAASSCISRVRCPVMYAFTVAVAAIVAEAFAIGNYTVIERAVNFAVMGLYTFLPLDKKVVKAALSIAAALQLLPEALATATLNPAFGGHQFYFRPEVASAKTLSRLGACIDGDVRVYYLGKFVNEGTCTVVHVLTKYNLVTGKLVGYSGTCEIPKIEGFDIVFYGGVVAYVARA